MHPSRCPCSTSPPPDRRRSTPTPSGDRGSWPSRRRSPVLSDPTFWSDVLARAGRQAVQVLVPILTVAALGGGISSVDPLAVGIAVGVAFIVVVLRALTGLRAGPDAAPWVDGLDRAISAAAAPLPAPAAAANSAALNPDWRSVAAAAASSAGLALVAMFTNPPATV